MNNTFEDIIKTDYIPTNFSGHDRSWQYRLSVVTQKLNYKAYRERFINAVTTAANNEPTETIDYYGSARWLMNTHTL